jgi:hypothetical protein
MTNSFIKQLPIILVTSDKSDSLTPALEIAMKSIDSFKESLEPSIKEFVYDNFGDVIYSYHKSCVIRLFLAHFEESNFLPKCIKIDFTQSPTSVFNTSDNDYGLVVKSDAMANPEFQFSLMNDIKRTKLFELKKQRHETMCLIIRSIEFLVSCFLVVKKKPDDVGTMFPLLDKCLIHHRGFRILMDECDFTDDDIISQLTFVRPKPSDAGALVTVGVDPQISRKLYSYVNGLIYDPLRAYNDAVADIDAPLASHQFLDMLCNDSPGTMPSLMIDGESSEIAATVSPKTNKSFRGELAQIKKMLTWNEDRVNAENAARLAAKKKKHIQKKKDKVKLSVVSTIVAKNLKINVKQPPCLTNDKKSPASLNSIDSPQHLKKNLTKQLGITSKAPPGVARVVLSSDSEFRDKSVPRPKIFLKDPPGNVYQPKCPSQENILNVVDTKKIRSKNRAVKSILRSSCESIKSPQRKKMFLMEHPPTTSDTESSFADIPPEPAKYRAKTKIITLKEPPPATSEIASPFAVITSEPKQHHRPWYDHGPIKRLRLIQKKKLEKALVRRDTRPTCREDKFVQKKPPPSIYDNMWNDEQYKYYDNRTLEEYENDYRTMAIEASLNMWRPNVRMGGNLFDDDPQTISTLIEDEEKLPIPASNCPKSSQSESSEEDYESQNIFDYAKNLRENC